MFLSTFGQCDAPQSYLVNKGISKEDVFLFFGWFRQTEGDIHNGTLRYVKRAPNLHVIYSYLQVRDIITKKEDLLKRCPWHPHALDHFTKKTSNAIYLPTDSLSFDKSKLGFGNFMFSEKFILTKSGFSRAIWEEKPSLSLENIDRHVKNSAKNGGIYYSGQWQELVLKESKETDDWLKELFFDN